MFENHIREGVKFEAKIARIWINIRRLKIFEKITT